MKAASATKHPVRESGTSCSRAARATGCATTRRCARRCARTCREIIAGGDVINDGARTVRVPVRMLEHYHFRLRNPEEQQGAGQGKAKPGDVFSDPSKDKGPGQKGGGGRDDGGVQLLLEFKVDDIVDWLWEEMQLPNLKARSGPAAESRLDARGLGSPRRALAARPPPLLQGIREAPRHRGRNPVLHR